jgi:DNA repair exonuclease SbcCD ATPase subunit
MAKRKATKRKKKITAAGIFITKLDKMRSEIQNLETQRLVDNKRIERMKNTATQMEILAAENKSALEQYRTTLTTLDQTKKTYDQEYSKQRTSSLKALKNRTGDIENLKTRYEEYRGVKARDYQAAAAKEAKAEQDLETSKEHFKQAEKDYHATLIYRQEIEKSFGELKNLKDQIEKERNYRNRYFLNEDLKVLLDKTEPKRYRDFAGELAKTLNSLELARETLNEKESALEKARAEAESLKSELEVLDRTRREKILAKL